MRMTAQSGCENFSQSDVNNDDSWGFSQKFVKFREIGRSNLTFPSPPPFEATNRSKDIPLMASRRRRQPLNANHNDDDDFDLTW